ncbi:response regulator [Panacagrimonas sp.]|uniref:response regulator n=1 Tax=Panacagrimonas sp. TaxID=2480088 RepID=UPI003B51ADA9
MSASSSGVVPVIMLVEDNPADLRLTQEVFEEAAFEHRLLVARDGEQALAMLRGLPPHLDLPKPDIVLLDLNIPRKNGLEVLRAVRQDPGLRRLPVLILSTSRAETDFAAAYDAGANAFVTKPTDWGEFAELARLIRDFWLKVVQLPPRSAP